uniref:Uncharacterized protein n=1 Tax=Romanomermis culicivorax TaxID=13658 RepID=A0A915JCC3_ROMCU
MMQCQLDSLCLRESFVLTTYNGKQEIEAVQGTAPSLPTELPKSQLHKFLEAVKSQPSSEQ